jgi:hypothetical protein
LSLGLVNDDEMTVIGCPRFGRSNASDRLHSLRWFLQLTHSRLATDVVESSPGTSVAYQFGLVGPITDSASALS